MATTTFRNYEGPQDAGMQYELWLRATEGLPYAWRSNLPNVHYQLRHADTYPGCRIYAERAGELVGYIGTHPPFDWSDDWRVIPFGFPWTHPADDALAEELYSRMMQATPEVYADAPPAVAYVQRFRGSWENPIAFMKERGWQQRWNLPILALPTADSASPGSAPALQVTESDLETLCELAAADPHFTGAATPEGLKTQFAGGWLELGSLWHVPGLSAFEMEVRKPWGEIRWLATHPKAEDSEVFWRTLRAVGRQQDATEVYVTIQEDEQSRQAQLERQGFTQRDSGLYLVRDI